MSREALRGHPQLFDHLNEAHGFRLLKREGFETIKLLPERPGERTADYEASGPGKTRAFLEVKTIHESEDELELRQGGPGRAPAIRELEYGIGPELHKKIVGAIEDAVAQIGEVSAEVRRIVLLCVSLDQTLEADSARDLARMREEHKAQGFELVFFTEQEMLREHLLQAGADVLPPPLSTPRSH